MQLSSHTYSCLAAISCPDFLDNTHTAQPDEVHTQMKKLIFWEFVLVGLDKDEKSKGLWNRY